MTSLLDLVPMHATVPVRGQDINVRAVDAMVLVRLMMETPELRKVFAGKQTNPDEVQNLVMSIPDVLNTVIGYGTSPEEYDAAGEPTKVDVEPFIKKARTLSIGEKTALFLKICEVTFPQGLGPFLESVVDFGERSVPPSVAGRIKALGTKSPEPSATSPKEATEQGTSGA